MCKRDIVEKLKTRIGFESCYSVDARGHSGGIAMLWRKDEEGKLISFSSNHIDMIVSKVGMADWRLTGVYGEPDRRYRRRTLDLIRSMKAQLDDP